mmetsp:Transcript_17559/g.26917  ORF Transcript_17559/g.26917 Transcript_17559/m.26917 type:complete len:229 (-) Transcript_17559:1025-1711(-)
MLLWTNHHPRTAYPHPSDHLLGSHSIVFHHVRSDTRSGPSQPRLTMNSHAFIRSNTLHITHYRMQNTHLRTTPIQIVVFDMSYPRIHKLILIITLLIQPHYQSDIGLEKVGDVILRSQHTKSFGGNDLLILRTSHGKDLVLDDPIQISILDLFKVFVFVDVKGGGVACSQSPLLLTSFYDVTTTTTIATITIPPLLLDTPALSSRHTSHRRSIPKLEETKFTCSIQPL